MKKLWIIAALLFVGFVAPLEAGLLEYVQKKDTSFEWKLEKATKAEAGEIYHFTLTSQTWQKIVWKHDLLLFVPKGLKKRSTVLLLNTGGRPRNKHYFFAFLMANKIKAPLAVLFQVPNQPLFGGKKEDSLIAETFVRYMKTKDESWPLLFPMVKSVVRAMDVIQAYADKNWNQKVKNFIITGSSKRGWTTWLTGAADKRVKAIMPMVIDTLNMKKQIEHQHKSYDGVVSKKLHDYKDRGLLGLLGTPKAKRLLQLVDPYSYRNRLTMPKLILMGTNDPYWVIDSLNLYWKDLKGEKYILYVPNAGHGLWERTPDGKINNDRSMNGLAAFTRHMATDTPLPSISWKSQKTKGKVILSTHSSPSPLGGRMWIAHSPVRDFRKAKWEPRSIPIFECMTSAEVETPQEGYRAFYIELDFQIQELKYTLCTQVTVLGGPAKKDITTKDKKKDGQKGG